MPLDLEHVLRRLMTHEPMKLSEVTSREAGVYALYDHEHRPAYIGLSTNLRRRIWNNHAAADGNSHKFSTAYNAGRMFHCRKNPSSCPTDGPVAKKLRTLFAREFCRAVIYPLPGFSKRDLDPVEAALRSMAPAQATRWNDIKALDAREPAELVDQLLTALNWNAVQRDAIQRQAARHGTL
jgi:hypothetical protein